MPNTRVPAIQQRLRADAESICFKCFHRKVCRAIDNQPCIECNQFTDANGVTVQEWISVKDQEEPTENGTYLCHGYWFGSRREQTETAEFFGEWNIANNFILTHWMPLPKLPQPPKGE